MAVTTVSQPTPRLTVRREDITFSRGSHGSGGTPPPTDSGNAAGKPAGARSLYFVHPVVDFLAIGGASLLVFGAALLFKWSAVAVAQLAVLLSWFVNYPHFAATSYRLYHRWENIRQYPITAIGAPIIVTLFAVGGILSPDILAPAFIKLYILWSPYHFSAQSVGITLIYARRAGIKIDGNFRRVLSWYIFGSFVAMSGLAEVGIMDIRYFGVHYPSLGLPQWVAYACVGFLVLSTLAFTGFVVRWSVQNHRLFPLIIVLPGLSQIIWFVVGGGVANFVPLVPFFHSLQYLLIAWMFHIKERHDTAAAQSRRGGWFVTKETVFWGAIIIVSGAFLFEALPHLVSSYANVPFTFAAGVILSAVQIHHFFVDGVVWKLRNSRVSSPLMVDLDDLINPPPTNETPASPAFVPAVAGAVRP